MNFREWSTANKGKYTQKQRKEAWAKYKNALSDNTTDNSTIKTLVNETNHIGTGGTTTDSIASRLESLPKTPKRIRSPRAGTVVETTEIVNLTIDAPFLINLLKRYVKVPKLIQILKANPELEKMLNQNVGFWADVYFVNYGRTAVYLQAVRSGNKNPQAWKEMVMQEYRRRHPI